MAPPMTPPTVAGSSGPASDSSQQLSSTNDDSSVGPKVWERPWTIEEIKAAAGKWSLAGDAGLLLHLQNFSQTILSKTHEIENQVNKLVNETKSTGVKVNNVFNDFIMLANSQFVENRVYDDDVSGKETTNNNNKEPEMSKEEREVMMVQKIAQAVNSGLNVIDESFEKLDTNAGNSESEDDDAAYTVDPIFEAKDPYIHRPLPFLIGSNDFMRDDNVGLIEIFSEEDDGETDHGSLSDDSEPEKGKLDQIESEYTDEDMDYDDTAPPPKRKSTRATESTYDSEDSDGDLFGTKDSQSGSDDEEDDSFEKKSKPKADRSFSDEDEEEEENEDKGSTPEKPFNKSSLQAELAARLGVPERKDSTASNSQKKKTKARKNTVKEPTPAINHFGGFPEEDNSAFDVFPAKKGLFSDNDNEEGGLFDDIPRKPSIDQSKKTPPSHGFSDDEIDDLFSPTNTSSSSQKPKSHRSSIVSATSEKGLFDDDDDDNEREEDKNAGLFTSSGFKPQPKDDLPKSKPVSNLFGDNDSEASDDGDLFSNITAKKPIETKQTGDKRDPVDSKMSVSTSKPVRSESSTSSLLSKPSETVKQSPLQSSDSLFADNDNDDLFLSKPVPNTQKSKAKSSDFSLFDDDDDDDDPIADVFSKSTKKPSVPEPSNAKTTDKPEKSDLFDSSEDDFVSSKPKDNVKKKPVGGVSIFGGTDLFSSKLLAKDKKKEEKPDEPAPAPARKSTTLSLFDNDEDEDDDFFNSVSKPSPSSQSSDSSTTAATTTSTPGSSYSSKTTTVVSTTKVRTKSLFEDEDILFRSSEENPTVDLFSSQGPLASKKNEQETSERKESSSDLFADDGSTSVEKSSIKITETIQQTSVRKPIGGVSIFGGIDFSEIKKKKKSDGEEIFTENTVSVNVEEKSTAKAPAPPVKPKKILKIQSDLTDGLYTEPDIPPLVPPTSFGNEEPQSASVSFDEPASAQILESATKKRARIQLKRRPPTRKPRPVTASDLDTDTPSATSPQTAAPYLESVTSPLSPDTASSTAADPFGVMSAPAIFPDKDPFQYNDVGVTTTTTTTAKSTVDGSEPLSTAPSESTSTSKPLDTSINTKNELVSSMEKSLSLKSSNIKHDDEDDLFGSGTKTTSSTVTSSSVSTKGGKTTLLTSTTTTTKTSSASANTSAIFDDDDSDIFADSDLLLNKKKDKKSALTDDLDDIFASSSLKTKSNIKKEVSSKIKKNITEEANIFEDDTDIFADIPAAKPKEKKTTVMKTKPLFKEDIDDIFGSDSLLQGSKKVEKTVTVKKVEEKTKVENVSSPLSSSQKPTSIFDDNDDDDDLFDDPLNIKKQ
ncbi:WASH complex subunit 2 isoform X1 [Octopus bimaculoides]|nr:WASH complex subunit 2 isoform X1 [Octopus bimaculoides]|eukprot:XP_014781210.1 PREDICTED: WASH complex subunit FAM21-like isoform X1 [Octopus bimaculoides]